MLIGAQIVIYRVSGTATAPPDNGLAGDDGDREEETAEEAEEAAASDRDVAPCDLCHL